MREGVDSSELQYQASLNPANARITCNRLRRNSKRHNDAVISQPHLSSFRPSEATDTHFKNFGERFALTASCLFW